MTGQQLDTCMVCGCLEVFGVQPNRALNLFRVEAKRGRIVQGKEKGLYQKRLTKQSACRFKAKALQQLVGVQANTGFFGGFADAGGQ